MTTCCKNSFINLARTRIKLEQPTDTTSVYGTPVKSWAEYGSRWAIVEPKSISELSENGQLINKVTYKITIRYDANITGAWRIDLKGVKLNIIGIKDLKDDMKTFGSVFQEMLAVEGEIS